VRRNVTDTHNKLDRCRRAAFNLDFYTDVQDLSYLEDLVAESAGPRFRALSHAIVEVVEDFGLVSFQTLCVEDKQSMASLLKTVDAALGYVDKPLDPSQPGPSLVFRSLESTTPLERTADVQERYIDRPEAFREHDRQGWAREGELRAAAEARRRKEQAEQSRPP
jgi:hypothetical protein